MAKTSCFLPSLDTVKTGLSNKPVPDQNRQNKNKNQFTPISEQAYALDKSEMKKKLEEQNKTIERIQGQMAMMLQGIMERDKQYFEKKYAPTRTPTR